METLRVQTKRWWPAAFAAARYVAYMALLTYHQWHISMKDQWNNLTEWDQINVICAIGLSILIALGAIMNDKWSKARNDSK